MNRPEAEMIATAISHYRPAWLKTSLTTMLSNLPPEHRDKPARDIALALTWLAFDPEQQTPRLLREHGPWWNLAALTGPGTQPATPRNPAPVATCHHQLRVADCQPCTQRYQQAATRGAAKARQALKTPPNATERHQTTQDTRP